MERRQLVIFCGKRDTSEPMATTSMEVTMPQASLEGLRQSISEAKDIDELLSAISNLVGTTIFEKLKDKAVAFVGDESVRELNVREVEDSESPGIELSVFEGVQLFRIRFAPTGDHGYFLGDEMAKRELLKLITRQPPVVQRALESSHRRIGALRDALATIRDMAGKTGAEGAELFKFIDAILKKDELAG